MSASPVAVRLGSAAPDGILVPSGVASFRRRYLGPDAAEHFHNWAEMEETKLAARALQDLALNGPVGMSQQPEGYAVQYGMTLGLSLAAQLLTDPSVVFPEMFRVRPAPAPVPEPTYDGEPEDI